MYLATYLGLLRAAEETLAHSYRQVAAAHRAESDVFHLCQRFARQCDSHVAAMSTAVERYGERPQDEPGRLHAEGLSSARTGPVGLLRDLQDLYMLATFVDIIWTLIGQAGQGARDRELLDSVATCEGQTAVQIAWLRTRLEMTAPQALLVAS
jgi:hypothetical protein